MTTKSRYLLQGINAMNLRPRGSQTTTTTLKTRSRCKMWWLPSKLLSLRMTSSQMTKQMRNLNNKKTSNEATLFRSQSSIEKSKKQKTLSFSRKTRRRSSLSRRFWLRKKRSTTLSLCIIFRSTIRLTSVMSIMRIRRRIMTQTRRSLSRHFPWRQMWDSCS